MTAFVTAPPKWRTYLLLGRVSNLPTVWSNCLAGAALATTVLDLPRIAGLAVAMSMVYVAGMFLNDALDARFDAKHRPERPIPRGWISARETTVLGIVILAAGVAGAAASAVPGTLRVTLAAASGLAALVLIYDRWHKQNPLSPGIMALCRGMVYVTVGLAVEAVPAPALYGGAAILVAYVIALSQIARRDLLPGKGIAMLIAGISVVDAVLILVSGHPGVAAVALLCAPLTLLLQRYAPGT
jgi:4-hydroxybenzoate polyprenyltransferase